jgi:hypothetical protein
MTGEQYKRLIAATKDLADLEFELRDDRAAAEAEDKALIRRVCGNLEKARSELEKAIGAAAVRQTS